MFFRGKTLAITFKKLFNITKNSLSFCISTMTAPNIKLNNGLNMPALGLGTYLVSIIHFINNY